MYYLWICKTLLMHNCIKLMFGRSKGENEVKSQRVLYENPPPPQKKKTHLISRYTRHIAFREGEPPFATCNLYVL